MHSVRDLGVGVSPGDWLVLELYEDSGCTTGCLATAHCALDLLPAGGPAITLPLRRCGDPRSCVGGASGTLTVARLPWLPAFHTSKTLFFVRHGQSRWNDAQKSRRFDAMMAFDHPLTRAGADQALALRERWRAAAVATQERRATRAARLAARPPSGGGAVAATAVITTTAVEDAFAEFCSPAASAAQPAAAYTGTAASAALAGDVAFGGGAGEEEEDDWVEAFLNASLLGSSPLTRAVQTAMLVLHGHPMLGSMEGGAAGGTERCKLTLLRAAREIKRGVGSLDSVGKCPGGPELVARCARMLREELPPGLFEQLIQAACDESLVDVNDTAGVEWWTAADDVDTDGDVGLRVADLLSTLQFAPGNSAVLVGHSLLFRDLMRRLTLTSSTAFGAVPPAAASLCAQLCEAKLCNAGCCALRLSWGRGGAVRITDARLLFGSTLASD